MGKSSKDKRDAYYRLAKEQGWRARSAFKLLQLDEQFDLLRGATRVVDLCAAPGSWSQVLSRALVERERIGRKAWEDGRAAAAARARGIKAGLPPPLPGDGDGADAEAARQEDEEEEERRRRDVRIVAVDLQPMSPLPGVTMLQADITHPSTVPLLLRALGVDSASSPSQRPVDLVLSDGAPDVTGLHDVDAYVQRTLVGAALRLAARVLRPGGAFAAKIFRSGAAAALLAAQARVLFGDVVVAKPRSSRASSLEAFLVCRAFMPMGSPPRALAAGMVGGLAAGRVADGDGDAAAVVEIELQEHAWMAPPSPAAGGGNDDDDLPSGWDSDAWIAPFLACGDLSSWDSDASCPLPGDGTSPLDPVQPPTAPPYARALAARRAAGGGATSKKTNPPILPAVAAAAGGRGRDAGNETRCAAPAAGAPQPLQDESAAP